MINILSFYPWFKLDKLNTFVALAIALFTVLTLFYSFSFMKGKPKLFQYYSCIVLTAVSSLLAVLSNNLIILLVFWGFLGFLLFLLINLSDDAEEISKKTFIIVGGSDALMLLGVGIIYYITDTFQMDSVRLSLDNKLAIVSYVCIAIACFAKAGAMPFHSWIPDCAKEAPLPAVAFIVASLDKLLGIYLLARISLDIFIMNQAMNILLMIVGAVTIIAAVMMALVQHNMKRLLGYHSVSQVGYMVLGIGTGNPIGIAGGIFHMLNNAIYKSCLFFTAGNVEYRKKTTELNELGGLAKLMPLTYISCLVASLSISGVPPFNGFFSKWMIYQGIINQFQNSSFLMRVISIFCLAVAMFGSGLTLASFMKLLHAVFLGQGASGTTSRRTDEVPRTMWLPCIILAAICMTFGILANQIPLKIFIFPAVGNVSFTGIWYAGLSTLLIIIGLIFGLICFKLKQLKPNLRQSDTFVGGEELDLEGTRITGTEFYNTVQDISIIKYFYVKAQKGCFDIYEQSKKIFSFSKVLQSLHNGVLPSYMVWILLGMVGLFLAILK